MHVEFTFIDGPMKGSSFTGQLDTSDYANLWYAESKHGKVGCDFTTHSMEFYRAMAEAQSNDLPDIGGPYEQYIYRVCERSEEDRLVRIRAGVLTFRGRVSPWSF